MWLFNLLFSLSQLWYVEVRISRNVSVSPLEFEITGVDCSIYDKTGKIWKEPLRKMAVYEVQIFTGKHRGEGGGGGGGTERVLE